tara:strand:- start:32 stop:970 length:939 start_codon:yes stop_codon:yes gene_type:complete
VALTKITGEGVGDVDSLTVGTTSSGEFNALTISQANNTSGNESRIRFKRTTDAGSDREVAAIVADRLGGNDTDLVFETNTDGSDGAVEKMRLSHLGILSIDQLFGLSDTDTGIALGANGADIMQFYTGNSERGRFDSSGNFLIGTTTSSTATEPGVVITSNVQPGLFINNSTTSSGVSLILLRASHSTADETKFEVTAAGNVKSRTNSYGSFSDERLKEQIADASSQWDDIKAIEVKNFKFISDLDDADNPKMIGVVAQQVESVSPALVEDDADGIKTVKYSILYMKAVKALQEAMTRIETLETKVAALEGA